MLFDNLKVLNKRLAPVFSMVVFSVLLIQPAYCLEDTDGAEPASPVEKQAIEPEKQKAIEELLEVTELSQRLPLLIDAFKSNARRTFALAIIPSIKDAPHNKDKPRTELKKMVDDKASAMTDRYLELFKEQVDLKNLIKEVALQVYAKHFTTAEIQEITTFYKTPTGTKARTVMPEVARESMVLTQKLIRPKVKSIVNTVLTESKDDDKKDPEKKQVSE